MMYFVYYEQLALTIWREEILIKHSYFDSVSFRVKHIELHLVNKGGSCDAYKEMLYHYTAFITGFLEGKVFHESIAICES